MGVSWCWLVHYECQMASLGWAQRHSLAEKGARVKALSSPQEKAASCCTSPCLNKCVHFFAVDEKITETNQGLHSFWMLRLKSCYTNSRSVHQHQRSAILHPRPLFFFLQARGE